MLKTIKNYSEAKTKAEEVLKENQYLEVLDKKVGEEFVLGTYEQDNNKENGPEKIEWIILKNENGVLYAVSKYVLDAQVFNTHNGDGSTLKAWLKEDFYYAAFGEISDGFIAKVGLLTRDDMKTYNKIANKTPEWTAYAKAQEPEKHYSAGYSWWLDGAYFHGYGSKDVDMSVVTQSGSYSNNVSPITGVNGVRPAIIIDCVSADIDYYADDYADMENAGVTTRTESSVTTSNKTNNSNSTYKTSSKTKCNRCNGTGKVVLHYGNSWNQKEGYRYGEKCGRCGGSGYVN